MKLPDRQLAPVVIVAIAHVLSWAVMLYVRRHLVETGDESNSISVIIMGSPILWTAIALWETLTRHPDRRIVLTMAIVTTVLAYLGLMTLGILLSPIAVLLFLAYIKMRQTQ